MISDPCPFQIRPANQIERPDGRGVGVRAQPGGNQRRPWPWRAGRRPTDAPNANPLLGSKAARQIDPGNDFVLRLYLRDLAEVLPAGAAEFLPVTVSLNVGAKARERLVLEHLPRVIRMAFDYQGFGLPLGDLISEGNLGLMRAAELFDPLRNVRFSYYARPWIRVQMQRALSYQAWPVSLPSDFKWRRGQVSGAEERLTLRLNRLPADAEVARECKLKLPTVRRLRAASIPSFLPLDSPRPGQEAGLTLAEEIPDEQAPTPAQEAARRSDYEFLGRLMATLAPREQRVLRLRYGLEDGCERTFEEVGGLLGYCRQGIHRIESAALAKLRQHTRFLQLAERNGDRESPIHARPRIGRLGRGRRTSRPSPARK